MNVQKIAEAIADSPMPAGTCCVVAEHVITRIHVPELRRYCSPAIRSFISPQGGNAHYEAIGGAITLTEKGHRHANRVFCGTVVGHRRSSSCRNAHFFIPDSQSGRAALTWLIDLEQGRRGNFEHDPHRAVFEELSVPEHHDDSPVIDPDHPGWVSISYSYQGVCLQPSHSTSLNSVGVPTLLLSHLWRMNISKEIFDLLRDAHEQQIIFLNAYDLEKTAGGTQIGVLRDGKTIGLSLGLKPTFPAPHNPCR